MESGTDEGGNHCFVRKTAHHEKHRAGALSQKSEVQNV